MAQYNKFDMKRTTTHFQTAILTGKDVDISLYCSAFRELCLFFNSLGSVFHFVVKDVHDKIKILNTHAESEKGAHYKTVDSMVSYEIENDILKVKRSPPNGCRTLLRLHRALDFIALFLEKLKEPSKEKMSDIAYTSYQATLAKHHTWLIRKAVGMAVYTLPTRENLMKDFDQGTVSTVEEDMDKLQETLHSVYNVIHKYYEDNNILDLP